MHIEQAPESMVRNVSAHHQSSAAPTPCHLSIFCSAYELTVQKGWTTKRQMKGLICLTAKFKWDR